MHIEEVLGNLADQFIDFSLEKAHHFSMDSSERNSDDLEYIDLHLDVFKSISVSLLFDESTIQKQITFYSIVLDRLAMWWPLTTWMPPGLVYDLKKIVKKTYESHVSALCD